MCKAFDSVPGSDQVAAIDETVETTNGATSLRRERSLPLFSQAIEFRLSSATSNFFEDE